MFCAHTVGKPPIASVATTAPPAAAPFNRRRRLNLLAGLEFLRIIRRLPFEVLPLRIVPRDLREALRNTETQWSMIHPRGWHGKSEVGDDCPRTDGPCARRTNATRRAGCVCRR